MNLKILQSHKDLCDVVFFSWSFVVPILGLAATHTSWFMSATPVSLSHTPPLSVGSAVCLSIIKLMLSRTYYKGSSACQICFIIKRFKRTQKIKLYFTRSSWSFRMFISSWQDKAGLSPFTPSNTVASALCLFFPRHPNVCDSCSIGIKQTLDFRYDLGFLCCTGFPVFQMGHA